MGVVFLSRAWSTLFDAAFGNGKKLSLYKQHWHTFQDESQVFEVFTTATGGGARNNEMPKETHDPSIRCTNPRRRHDSTISKAVPSSSAGSCYCCCCCWWCLC